jgi:hypothetical protein
LLAYRHEDLRKEDNAWGFLTQFRKARRLSIAERDDASSGTENNSAAHVVRLEYI